MTEPNPYAFARRHLLGIEGLNRLEIESLLDLADEAVAISRAVPPMRNVEISAKETLNSRLIAILQIYHI